MKKEYIKPSFTEELVTVSIFVLADKSTGGGDYPSPFPAPKKKTQLF